MAFGFAARRVSRLQLERRSSKTRRHALELGGSLRGLQLGARGVLACVVQLLEGVVHLGALLLLLLVELALEYVALVADHGHRPLQRLQLQQTGGFAPHHCLHALAGSGKLVAQVGYRVRKLRLATARRLQRLLQRLHL